MAFEPLIIFLIVGAVAGWLAGVLVRGYGFGLLGNIAVGVLGSFLGTWLFGRLALFQGASVTGELVGATLGALVLLVLLRLVRRPA